MKNLILFSCFVIFINCKPQNKESDISPSASLQKNSTKTKVNTLSDSSFGKNSSSDDDNKTIMNSEKEYTNMIIKYQEDLIIPQNDLEKIPSEFKEQIINLFSKPIYFELRTNLGQSSYQIISDDSKVYSSSDAGKTNETTVILPTLNVYKDFINLELIKQDQLLNRTYLIKDRLNKIDWRITNDIIKIDNFSCKKATVTIKNKDITAYFTEEIPVGDGPSIFYGLPGLILKVVAPDRTYSVLEINFKKNLDIQKFTNGIAVTPKGFEEITNKMKENPTTTIQNEVRQ